MAVPHPGGGGGSLSIGREESFQLGRPPEHPPLRCGDHDVLIRREELHDPWAVAPRQGGTETLQNTDQRSCSLSICLHVAAFVKASAFAGSIRTPGPMVVDSVIERRYCPFAAAGLARTMASMSAEKLASN